MALTWIAEVDDFSPDSAAMALENQSATNYFYLVNPAAADLDTIGNTVLGTVDVNVAGDGKVHRTLPLSHPQWSNLYASRIASYQGFGYKGSDPLVTAQKIAATANLVAPAISDWWKYWVYRVGIEFTPRPFAIVNDMYIVARSSSWYNDSGVLTSFMYQPEYERYCDYEIRPKFNAVTAQQGSMAFRSTSSDINGKIFPGMPKMPVDTEIMRFIQYQVPYRFYSSRNAFFRRFMFRINQNSWTSTNGQFTFNPGELLLINCEAKRYSPPSPEILDEGFPQTDKWANIEYTFLVTRRTSSDTPFFYDTTNRNFIAAGWNLMPYVIDRKYHYATSRPTGGVLKTPSFYSFPVESLFMDPDTGGAFSP